LVEPSESATLFSVANGYLGLRGAWGPERWVYLNGFHETYRIQHAENAYGFATVGQVIQPVPDATFFEIRINGLALISRTGALRSDASLVAREQVVDWRSGVATLTDTWRVGDLEVRVVVSRMAALFEAHLAVATCSVTTDADCRIELVAPLTSAGPAEEASADPRVGERAVGGGLDSGGVWTRDTTTYSSQRCRNSGLSVVVGVRTQAAGGRVHTDADGTTRVEFPIGTEAEAVRYIAYHADLVPPIGVVAGLAVTEMDSRAMLATHCTQTIEQAHQLGVDELWRRQAAYLADFWRRSDVVVGTEAGFQQAVRWSIFQLAQVSAQVDGHGIAAKGLSGSGYSGHYFWDTEIFVLPFLTYTNPEAARSVLAYRQAMLPAARQRAKTMSLKGALFPWRTINGEEASAYYPAGTAQYHLNADIAYAVRQYLGVTDDQQFGADQGLQILIETARMWADMGFYGADGYFHIHGVTGPDEYSAVVDDNYYTNAMARFNLLAAAQACEEIGWPVVLEKGLGADTSEVAAWREAARQMYLPWDRDRGVHPQDAAFLGRQPWRFEPVDSQPLLLRYHPLVIYRHQVLKQTDLVLALHLLSDQFTDEEKRADFEFYNPLTTGDSTLSGCTQAVIAAELGQTDQALSYLESALFVDLANTHGNTGDGVHVANAGGVWSALVAGFGGLRDSGGHYRLDPPDLPAAWRSLQFTLQLRGSLVKVQLSHRSITLDLLAGDDVALPVLGQIVRLSADDRSWQGERLRS
jgi:alpha,alpha-trehalose phosphorylase